MFALNEDLLRATRRFEASGRPLGRDFAQSEAWRAGQAEEDEARKARAWARAGDWAARLRLWVARRPAVE